MPPVAAPATASFAIADCTHGADCRPADYEAALGCLGTHSTRTMEQAAAILGRRVGYLRNALSPYDGAHNLQAQLIAPLTRALENPALLRRIAADAGFGIYRLPQTTGDGDVPLLALADAMHAVGETAKHLRDALGNRVIDPREARDITAHANAAIVDLVALVAGVNLHAEFSR